MAVTYFFNLTFSSGQIFSAAQVTDMSFLYFSGHMKSK